MESMWIWILFGALIVLLLLANQSQRGNPVLKQSYEGLVRLVDRVKRGQSEYGDVEEWNRFWSLMETFPNDFNKLDREIGLRGAFAQYLETHYPEDPRLPVLKAAAGYKKDTIWGMRINRNGDE